MQFAITLKNGEQIMCGIANIVGSFTSDANRFHRPGMEIEFSKLDEAGREFLSEVSQASKEASSIAGKQSTSPVQPPSSDHLFPKPAAIASPPPHPVDAVSDVPLESEDVVAVAPTKTLSSSPVIAIAPLEDSQAPSPPSGEIGSSDDPEKPDAAKLDAGKLDAGKLDARDDSIPLKNVEAKPPCKSTAWPSKVAEPERIQGSKFVLPANPLGGLPATSLEAFVDCVLYEETGEIDISSLIDLSTVPKAEPLPTTPLIEPNTAPDSEELPPPHFLQHTITNGQAVFLALICLFAGLGFGLFLGSSGETQTALADTKKPQANTNADLLQPPDDPHNLRINLTGTAPQTPALTKLAPVTRVDSELPEAALAPDTDSVSAVQDPKVKSLDLQPELGIAETTPTEDKALGDCEMLLDIEPTTASIEIDKVALKARVTQVQVPCGTHSYRVRHPRYQDRQGEVHLSQGEPTPLRLRLTRPTVTLKVQSIPKGATIMINGRNAGKTPWKRKVPAFENVRISVSSPGYRTQARKVYPKKSATVSIRMLKQVYKPPSRKR